MIGCIAKEHFDERLPGGLGWGRSLSRGKCRKKANSGGEKEWAHLHLPERRWKRIRVVPAG
jgi:hypothetical protein